MADREVRENTGALFKKDPDDVKSDRHPGWNGNFNVTCPECGCNSEGYLDAWVKQSDRVTGGKFFSMTMKFKEKRRATIKKGSSSKREREPGEDDDID